MFRRTNFFGACIACGLCLLMLLAGTRYTDNVNYRPSSESRRNIRNFLKTVSEDVNDVQHYKDLDLDYANIDQIIERTRSKIDKKLKKSLEGVSDLSELILESGGNPQRSLIISTWRSGTTFLGEVINAVPGNYYHYEPLLNYDIIQIRGPPQSVSAIKRLRKLLNCDYSEMKDYFHYGQTHPHQFSHNVRLWEHCRFYKDLCFDVQFQSSFCKLFPFQSMKVVRVRLRLIEELLHDFINLKVVLLVRDPRGTMQSRQHRDWCLPSPDCWNPELMCADLVNDYVAAGRLKKRYPDRFKVLRYEDLALNPNSTSYDLLKFLKLPATESVDRFLEVHTNREEGGVSSTFRKSKEVPFRWKNLLDFKYVEQVQTVCGEAMSHWGYNKAHNATHMASTDFYPIREYVVG